MFKFKKRQINSTDISFIEKDSSLKDIYIIGNGPSLNKFCNKNFNNKFTIGTNRSWLWGNTDILIWRDPRITDEIDFFQLDKMEKVRWICSSNKAFESSTLNEYSYILQMIDYTFSDRWMKDILKTNIKWNGIVFHAIALAKFISADANIHLIGIDLDYESDHHFFNNHPGFNRGFYKKFWTPDNFNFKKRLDMMYENFKKLQETQR